MVRRHEPTDQEWELLDPLIPGRDGAARVEDRRVINGMVYKIRTGFSWRDLPEGYGPRKTVYTRFRHYTLEEVFTETLQHIQARADRGRRHRLAGPDRLHHPPRPPARHRHRPERGGISGTNRTSTPSADPEAD